MERALSTKRIDSAVGMMLIFQRQEFKKLLMQENY